MKTIIDWVKTIGVKGWIVFIILVISCCNADAQTVTRSGNTFIATSTRSTRSNAIETKYEYKDTDGKTYKIFITQNGRCFIKRISAKSGKEYNKYLPETISREISKELNIEYKEKKK